MISTILANLSKDFVYDLIGQVPAMTRNGMGTVFAMSVEN